MLKPIWQWIDERWPLSALLRLSLEEDIPGGSSFAYTLGSATLIVFVIQAITGIWQLFYYVPAVDHAYDSVSYLRTEVPFGWLIHGLHYWGASAMIILVVVHMARVFIWGAYKRPRELTWLVGVSLLIFSLGMSFTGAPLPWDERGYWAAEVGTSIAGTVPLVGDLAKRLLRVGEAMGQLTLSRFFILHVALLPGALLALIGIHLVAFRRFGSVGPWDKAKRQRNGRFWPDQVFKDGLLAIIIFLVLVGLSAFVPPPFAGPADPVDTSYLPKPEWNFLFLYQALKFFPSRLEPLGTVGIPLVGILVLVLLPFLDRRPERNPLHRPIVMLGGLIAAMALIALTITGYYSRPGSAQAAAPSPPVASVVHLPANAREGAKLFQSLGCVGCHRVNGTGGTAGPDLSHEALRGRARQWLVSQIRDPQSHDPNTGMPAFASLSDAQVNQLADYLLSLGAQGTPLPTQSGGVATGTPTVAPTTQVVTPTAMVTITESVSPTSSTENGSPGSASAIIGSAGHGAVLFDRDCASCHGPQGTDNVPNPGSADGTVPPLNPIDPELASKNPQTFVDNMDRIIQHGSTPDGPNPQLDMPAFGDDNTLTQQEIADLEAYVLQLNGVDRGQLEYPGIAPRRFFEFALGAFGLVGLGLGGLWLVRSKRSATQHTGKE
jgi:ubiquinol-cytochrome c reductase cytochrome b subunit